LNKSEEKNFVIHKINISIKMNAFGYYVASMLSVPIVYAAARVGIFGKNTITIDLKKGAYTNVSSINNIMKNYNLPWDSISVYVDDIQSDCRCPEEASAKCIVSMISVRPTEIVENRPGWGATTVIKI
jgi:hypothetical protein